MSINATPLLEIYCCCFVSAADAQSVGDSYVFIARQHIMRDTDIAIMSVCPPVRPSVRFNHRQRISAFRLLNIVTLR